MNFVEMVAHLRQTPDPHYHRVRRPSWPSGLRLHLSTKDTSVEYSRHFVIELPNGFNVPYRISDADVSAKDWETA